MEYTMDVIKNKQRLLMNIRMLGESMSSWHGRSSGCKWRRQPVDMEGHEQPTRGVPPDCGSVMGLTSPHHKK
jgi:hypothetical protein